MKKELISPENLIKQFWQEIEGDKLDNGYYRWWVFYKNDSELHITYEYDSNGNFLSGYIEFNGEALKGREITLLDIQLLTEIM